MANAQRNTRGLVAGTSISEIQGQQLAKEPALPQVPDQVRSLNEDIGMLESAVTDIESRLGDYAHPGGPIGDCEADRPPLVGMAELIRTSAQRVRWATYRLQDLYRRLEV